MREVEVKAKVRDSGALEAALVALGCELGEALVQDDTVFVKSASSMEEFLNNDFFLRLRETDGRVIFTLKYHPDRTLDVAVDSMPIEHETDVSARGEVEAMLGLLGFSPELRIRKTRRTGHYGNWEVCVDEVEGLGSFIEVEELADHDADVAAVSARLKDFLASLGIPEGDLGARRYDVQLLEKRFGA